MKVVIIPQLTDNYAYLIVDEATKMAAVVDCAEAQAVIEAAKRERATLTAVLPTHHHYDHVGGHEALLASHPQLAVYGVDERIPGLTQRVEDGATVAIGNLALRVLLIPAHTTGHVAYYCSQEHALFTGDTLFAGGCGRLFEGDAAMMLRSLSLLLALPDDTRVYFGHEYTEKNLRFALSLEPQNQALRRQYDRVVELVKRHQPTTPTTLAIEQATNPFLRCRSPELRATLRRQYPELATDEVSIFAKVRALKDVF
ncbi:MAG: hydroxyacylglutathione hydrolase [Deltaproteobacteria bacterium]|nr:hydroxyacylglutathione hydrolase [Deltaproteobacteria bacterium]